MNADQQLKLDVITKLDSKKITLKQAIRILNKSESTIYRYLAEFQQLGALFTQHKNKDKTPTNKIDQSLEGQIVTLCKDEFKKFNRTHAWEEITEKYDLKISKSTFNRICNRNNLLNKNIKKRKPRGRYRRNRMKEIGIMLQLDGSPHLWFGRRKTCLVAIIDDATSDILYGEFSPTETTFACMNVIKKVLKEYGVFEILYTDRAGIFGKNPINHFDAVKREGFSSLKECLATFNINIIYAFSPQAKGRVERAFKTLQDRLVAELDYHNINTIQEANDYLNNVYLKKHRDRFTLKGKRSSFVPLIPGLDLDQIFYMKETRKVKNDHTFSYKGVIYDLEKSQENHSGKEIEIRSYPNGKVSFYIDDKQVELKEGVKFAI